MLRNDGMKKICDQQQKEEKLGIRDIEELMGIRRSRYERSHGGALRQKIKNLEEVNMKKQLSFLLFRSRNHPVRSFPLASSIYT